MAITQQQLAQILPGNPYVEHWCDALNKILPDYDITTSQLNTVSNGTHEIVISLLLNNRYKVTCPQHTF